MIKSNLVSYLNLYGSGIITMQENNIPLGVFKLYFIMSIMSLKIGIWRKYEEKENPVIVSSWSLFWHHLFSCTRLEVLVCPVVVPLMSHHRQEDSLIAISTQVTKIAFSDFRVDIRYCPYWGRIPSIVREERISLSSILRRRSSREYWIN